MGVEWCICMDHLQKRCALWTSKFPIERERERERAEMGAPTSDKSVKICSHLTYRTDQNRVWHSLME